MVNYFWVGGTGNVNNTNTANIATSSGGAGGAGPVTSADSLTFDSNSSAGNYTATISTVFVVNNLVLGAPASGTLTWTGPNGVNVGGNFSIAASGVSITQTSGIAFVSTSLGNTVTTNGVSLASLSSVNFNGVGGGWTLTGALTCSSFILTNGAFSDGGYNVSCSVFNNSNANIRTLTRSGTWTITGTGSCYNGATDTNLALTDSGTVNCTYSGATTMNINTGTTSGSAPNNLNITAATGSVVFANGCFFKNLNFTGYTGAWTTGNGTVLGNMTLGSGMSSVASGNGLTFGGTSGTQTITTNGVAINSPLIINNSGTSVTLGGALTLGNAANGSVTLTAGTFVDAGFAVSIYAFSSSNSNTRTLTKTGVWNIAGNSTCWNTATITNFTLTDSSTTNFTYAGSSVTTISCGGIQLNNVNVTGGTYNLSLSLIHFNGNLDFTGSSCNVSMSNGGTVQGNLTLSTTMLWNASGNGLTLGGTSGTQTFTPNGVTFNTPLIVNNTGSGAQLGGALTMNTSGAADGTLTLTAGTFNDEGYSVSCFTWSSTNSNVRTLTRSGAWTLTGTGTIYNNGTSTNLTLNDTGSVTCTNAGAITISPGTTSGVALNSVKVNASTGALLLTGSSFWNNVDLTGYTGAMTNSTATFLGNLTLGIGQTLTNASNSWNFAGAGAQTFTPNGVSTPISLTFSNSGSGVTFAGAVTAAFTCTLTSGTLNDGGFNFTAPSFASSNSNVRSFVSSGTLTLTTAGTVLNFATSTNLTVNHTGTIKTTDNTSTAKTLALGGKTYNVIYFSGGAGTGAYIIGAASNTLGDIKFDASTVIQTLTLPASQTTTLLPGATFAIGGNASFQNVLNSSAGGTQATISCASGTISLTNVSLKDQKAQGGALFNSYTSNGCVNTSNNSGWNFMIDTVTLGGVSGTGAVGGANGQGFTGVSAIGRVGTEVPGPEAVPAGVSAIGSVGFGIPSTAKMLGGVAGIGVVGVEIPSDGIYPSGVAGIGAVGNVSVWIISPGKSWTVKARAQKFIVRAA